MSHARRRPPSALVALAWSAVAAIVVVGQLLDDDREAPIEAEQPAERSVGQPTRVPQLRSRDIGPTTSVPPSAVPPDTAPSKPRRELRRPFAATSRKFDSPLLTPRLHLPRVLTPKLTSLSKLLARARPGEPVAVTLTAYCLDGRTRRGNPVRTGIIAADPRIFPLARHVELHSGGRYLGRFLVDDTGGDVRGSRIDIWTPDCTDARRFGRRTGVATLLATGTR